MAKIDAMAQKEINKIVDDFMKKNKDKIQDWKSMDQMKQKIKQLDTTVSLLKDQNLKMIGMIQNLQSEVSQLKLKNDKTFQEWEKKIKAQ
ncbi:MAG: hypothetical protein AAFU49_05080 [Pseudomonadota bacterium]